MPHKLLLGFKQNPSGTDDYIDLGGGLNVNGKGYHLHSYLEGDVTTDDYGHMVRPITITLDIDGTDIADALSKYHAIDRYIQQTRIYLKQFKGNYAATTDGTWYSGFCATLTFQPVNATAPVYWDVLSGTIARDETFLGENYVGSVLENVTVTLMVRYAARGALVTLCNLVAMGSHEPPFDTQGSYFTAGWTFTTPAKWSIEIGPGKYGLQALKWAGTSSDTAYSNASLDIYQYNGGTPILYPKVSGAIWLKASGVTGTTTVTVETYNGSAWSTLGTVASVSGNLASWTYYKVENLSLPAGALQVRLKFVTPTSGTVYFDGAAIWRAASVPANGEYWTGGGQIGFTSTYLYGAVGDIEAPCLLHVGGPVDPVAVSAPAFNALMVGARPYKWTSTARDSIPGMAGRYANGTTNTALMWGTNGQDNTGTAAFATFSLSTIPNLPPILNVPRKYRAVLLYKSNVAITNARISMGSTSSFSIDQKLFTRTIPATSSAYKVFDLGDITYPPADTPLEDQLFTGFTSASAALGYSPFYFYFGSGSYSIQFSGFLLIPTEYFAYVYGSGNQTTIFTSMGDPENGSVKALQVQNTKGNYDASQASEILTSGTDNSDTLQIVPGHMQFEILPLGTRDSTYTDLYANYAATTNYTPTLVYQPRYLSGGM